MITLTNHLFEKHVLNANVPVIMTFYADSCPVCHLADEVLADLEDELHDRVKFVRMNFVDELALTREFHITAVPTMLIFWQGEEVARFRGEPSPPLIRNKIERLLPRNEPVRH